MTTRNAGHIGRVKQTYHDWLRDYFASQRNMGNIGRVKHNKTVFTVLFLKYNINNKIHIRLIRYYNLDFF